MYRIDCGLWNLLFLRSRKRYSLCEFDWEENLEKELIFVICTFVCVCVCVCMSVCVREREWKITAFKLQ